ncbi:MAG: hypothetical protein HYW08_05930, partial [candidate division NC10 bacterium]|nr:hypothetical protein [candidate division NC10 bacterium]
MTARLRLLLLLTCLVAAVALGVFALSQSRPVRQRALVWAQALLADAVGREVRVEEVTLRPWAGSLELTRVEVARDATLADGALFSAEAIRARWSWTALLRRRLVLRQITLVRPRIALAAATAPGLTLADILPVLFQVQPVQAGGWTLRVRRASLQDGQMAWVEADGTQGTLEGLAGNLAWREAADGTVSTAGTLSAQRVHLARGETTRQLERITLTLAGTADAVTVSAAEFFMADASVRVQGGIADLGGTPRLDLGLDIQAPLRAAFA